MSTKKKAPRDKLVTEEAASVRPSSYLLTAHAARITPVNHYLPCSNRANTLCGRAYGDIHPEDWRAMMAWTLEQPPERVCKQAEAFARAFTTGITQSTSEACSADAATTEVPIKSTNLSRVALQKMWRRHIATTLPCPLLHPCHTLTIDLAAGGLAEPTEGEEGTASSMTTTIAARHRPLAALIQRIVRAHTALCNAAVEATGEDGGVYDPAAAGCAALIGCTVYSNGYATPEQEQTTVSFAAAAAARKESATVRTRDLVLVQRGAALHVNVCCGLFYYSLQVLDATSRTVRTVSQIAEGLETICRHAAQHHAALAARDVSVEAKCDLLDFHSLLARMSGVQDDLRADLHRRLREVSAINVLSLDALEAGLFTVVLLAAGAEWQQRDCAAAHTGTVTAPAQWLHSGLSLYAPVGPDPTATATLASGQRTTCVLRSPATLAPMASLEYLVAQVSTTAALTTVVAAPQQQQQQPSRGEAADKVETDGEATCAAATTATAAAVAAALEGDTTGAAVGQEAVPGALGHGATFLELWLPLKHRIPLQPYAGAAVVPSWRDLPLTPEPSQTSTLSMAALCLALVAATERLLYDEGHRTRRPRVVLALHHPQCTVPSLALLYGDAVEEYIQALRSSSTLLAGEVKARLRQKALQCVARCIDDCMRCPYPLYWIARAQQQQERAQEDAETEVCVTVNLLPTRDEAAVVRGTFSSLGVPARLYVNCTAVSMRVRKQPLLSEGGVSAAELGFLPQHLTPAAQLRANLTVELTA